VRDGVGVEAVGDDAHRLRHERQLVHAGGRGWLVDLDEAGAGGGKVHRLVMDRAREVEHELTTRAVVLVEAPVGDGVRPGEHALDRSIRQALRELPGIDGHRMGAAHLADGDRLPVVAVAVAAHQAADLEAVHLLREERGHVAAVHLAVDQDVDAELLLEADPVLGRDALELGQLLGGQPTGGVIGACLDEVGRLRERADRGRPEAIAHERLPPGT
jgi:hypothetical protein